MEQDKNAIDRKIKALFGEYLIFFCSFELLMTSLNPFKIVTDLIFQ